MWGNIGDLIFFYYDFSPDYSSILDDYDDK